MSGHVSHSYLQGFDGTPRERDYLEDLDVDWRIILKLSFKKWDGKAGLD
jgi:hypothetical protein